MTGQLRKKGRRLRRRLGLPVLSRRAWLFVVLAFLGLVYVAVTVVGEFVVKTTQYAPELYELKDLRKEDVRRE